MVEQELKESITLSLTINILIATIINFFMDKSIFPEGFAKIVANYYDLSIIFSVLSFIFLYLNKSYLTLHDIERYYWLIMVNLSFTISALFLIMYPKILSLPLSIILVVICFTVNLVLSGYWLLGGLVYRVYFPKR